MLTRANRANTATLFFALGKIVHSAGLSYFSAEQFGQYISKTSEPEEIAKFTVNAFIILSILQSIVVNIFVNIPAFHRHITTTTPPAIDQAENAPSLPERLISSPLKAGAWTYTAMMAILGYFLTHQLSSLIASLSGTHDDDELWKSILVDICVAIVAGIVFLKYLTYDMKLCNENANRIAHAVTHRDIPINKAMVVSALLSLLTLSIYPVQAFFFAKPALENTPGIGRSSIAVDILTILSCLGTLITAFTWLPSIYDFFKSKQPGAQTGEGNEQPADNFLLRSAEGIAYFSGLHDAVIQGMSAYMGTIAVAALFDINPYGWIIALAALAMLNTTLIHTAFSIVPGVNATMNDIRTRFYRTGEPDIERGRLNPTLFQPANIISKEGEPLLGLPASISTAP
jgi:hypothetical protein